jgi:F-type H+-transporting ATPase subunit b
MNFIDIVKASPVTETNEISAVPITASETGDATEHLTAETSVESAGVLSSLGINGQMFVFQLINFALIAAVLWYLILKPVTKKMIERQKMIDDSLDNAKKVQENLAKSEKEYQIRIDEAKVEANRIIEKTQTEAEKLSADIKVKAKREIDGLVLQAREKIKEEKIEVISGIKKETVNLIVAAVEKILKEKLDSKKDKQLIEDSIKDLL